MYSAETPILYEDPYLVAVHKPAGLLVHRNAHTRHEPALLQILRHQLGKPLFPVHRLDRPTSGLMVMALDPQAARSLAGQFAARQVEKAYLAVVRGFLPQCGYVDAPLLSPSGQPQSARTEFTRLETAEIPEPVGRYATARYSLAHIEIQTGRRHQIRRHLAHIRHPIIGDVLRGDGRHNRFFREYFGLHRLLLASTSLRFTHPASQEKMLLTCPLAQEMLSIISMLNWTTSLASKF